MTDQTPLLRDDEFVIWQPSCVSIIEKGGKSEGRVIGGYCSTEHKDRQDEVVLQKGLDFSEFVKHGYYNDNHNQATGAVVGIPEVAEFHKGKGWYTEGTLLKGFKRADEIWDLAKSLVGTARRLGFSIEGKVLERKDNYIVKAKIRNVAITNVPVNTSCFPGDTRISGEAELIFRRPYSGELVEIVLSSGQKLSGTPNHPVLTQVGWVAIGQLDERKHLVCCRLGDSASSLSEAPHDVDDMPPTFDQAYNLALVVASLHRVDSGSAEQFHGDGRSGDVDVVTVDGELKRRFDASFVKHFGQGALSASDVRESLLASDCPSHQFFVRGLTTSSSVVCGHGKGVSLLLRKASETYSRGCSEVADGDSSLSKELDDSLVAAPKASSEGRSALPGEVVFNNIIRIGRREFSGHVYNLQTKQSWYAANGIVAHNCSWDILAKSMQPGGHVVTLEDDEVNQVWKCPTCSKAFVTEKGLLLHDGSQHGKGTRKSVSLGEEEGIALLMRVRPHYSEEICRRIFRLTQGAGR